ncbi:MAG TPA: tRNA lysidine(34) synthetase TilS [Bacteroidota bacterium]|nr:tRNA lysidine(34) synthetase TilS [Bacteroidota bacterium]
MRSSELGKSFSDFVGRHGLVRPAERIIAAVSGGVDSMVMLDLLNGLRSTIPFDLSVAHVNHGLRGPESDGDEDLVRKTARDLGLDFHLHRSVQPASTGGKVSGIQERAREERYRFFESLRAPSGRTRVATAHHRDDNAETVLFNFLRGAGIHGLTGIPVERSDGFVIRPLLFATRMEILAYAGDRAVTFREDSSNAGTGYTRNALRHEVIPSIESLVNPGLRETLARTSRLFTDLEAYIGMEVERILPTVVAAAEETAIRLHAGRLRELPVFLRESVLLHLSRKFNPYGIGYVHVRALLDLLDAQAGSSCPLRKNLHATREGDFLVLRSRPPAGEPFDFPVREGEAYAFEGFSFSSGPPAEVKFGSTPLQEYIDADRLGEDLRIRTWSDGDWFIPFGMSASKKLSDFFVDRKIPPAEKRRIPILVSGDAIVWVCGERLDDRFRVTPATKRVLQLRYDPAAR